MKQKTRILIYILIAAAVVIVGTIIILMSRNNAGQEKSHLDLGRTYLLDLSYDKAILEFKEAINIDPNDPEPYIELANTYEEIGDISNAIETLEDGYEKTGDERIKEKLDELQAKENGSEHNEDDVIAASEISAVTTTATAVNESETETSVTVEMATVPDLVGLNEEEAKKLCEDNGLKFTVQYSESNDVEKDIVMSQMIPAGTSVAKGISVPFAVSEGNSVQVELVAENLQFDYLADFEESGWAFAVRGNKGGYVNTSGKFVEVYDDVPTLDNEYLVYWAFARGIDFAEMDDSFYYEKSPLTVSNEGIYPYYKDGYWGYANINTGKIIVPCKYNAISAFKCERGFVGKIVESNWIYNIVDTNGNIVSCKEEIHEIDSSCFVNDIAIINGNCMIDKSGNIIYNDIVSQVNGGIANFIDGCTSVFERENGNIYSITTDQKVHKLFTREINEYGYYNALNVYGFMFGDYSFFSDNYDYITGIIDCNGNILCSNLKLKAYNYIYNQTKKCFVSDGTGYYLIDIYGNKLLSNIYERGVYTENFSAVCLNGKWGFIDDNGNTIIDFMYSSQYGVHLNGSVPTWALVELNEKLQIININGDIISQIEGKYYNKYSKQDYTVVITKNSNNEYAFYKIIV